MTSAEKRRGGAFAANMLALTDCAGALIRHSLGNRAKPQARPSIQPKFRMYTSTHRTLRKPRSVPRASLPHPLRSERETIPTVAADEHSAGRHFPLNIGSRDAPAAGLGLRTPLNERILRLAIREGTRGRMAPSADLAKECSPQVRDRLRRVPRWTPHPKWCEETYREEKS